MNVRMLLAMIAVVVLTRTTVAAETVDQRPNIIIVLSDDMGYTDLGCYGGEAATPVLDGLAADGIRFTQFYNIGRCCPTRASLLTGLYPHQAGVGHMLEETGLRGYTGGLNQHCRTIAEVMRPAGYATYMSGKWHVTNRLQRTVDEDQRNWPLQRGFDRFYGTIHGAGSFYDPNSLMRDNTLISPLADPSYSPDHFFYTDAIADNASMFIREHQQRSPDKPFFLYVTFTAAHWPMHARPETIEKYRGKFSESYDHYRSERLRRAVALGAVDPRWAMAPRDEGPWSRVDDRAWEERCMEVYAAMIDEMDQGMGRIVESLRETGVDDNTAIFFLQDNGGCAETLGRGKKLVYKDSEPKQIKPMTAEELQRDMIPKRTRNGRVVRMGQGVMPGDADTFIAYGRAWANVSNTPFREYKHWVHEGGIATPLIVHWPAGIDAGRRGQWEHQPGHLIDLAATCVDLGRATYPREIGGREITPLEGVSLKLALEGRALERSQPIFWEHEGNSAVRDGRWKIVRKGNMKSGTTTAWELYDMDADRTELHNLASSHPGVVQELSAAWDAWAERAWVKPWPWGRTDR